MESDVKRRIMVIHTIHIEEKKAISGRIGSAGPPALGTPAPAPEKIFLKKSPASAYSCVARAPDLPRRGGAGPVRALRNLGRDCQILRRGSQHDLAVALIPYRWRGLLAKNKPPGRDAGRSYSATAGSRGRFRCTFLFFVGAAERRSQRPLIPRTQWPERLQRRQQPRDWKPMLIVKLQFAIIAAN